jgi:hypothetical protein
MGDPFDASTYPRNIEPIYRTFMPNEPVQLYSDKLGVSHEGGQFECDGSIRLGWLPRPSLDFMLPELPPEVRVDLLPASLTIKGTAKPLNAHVSGVSNWVRLPGQGSSANGIVDPSEVGAGGQLAYVVFHIPNFHYYWGEPIAYLSTGGATLARRRASVEAGEWKLTIDLVKYDGVDLQKALKACAGYGITHVGRIERVDGATFSASDALEILDAVSVFLSFCRGAWACCALPVGFDSCGGRVWEQWATPRAEQWRSVSSWFRHQDGSAMMGVFEGFLRLWMAETWRRPLRIACSWYVESNLLAGAIEGAMVLAHTALELLAWATLVQGRQMLSTDGFDRLPAADRLLLLVSLAGIPTRIPDSFSDLCTVAKAENWQTGPHAIAELRNAIVHPTKKHFDKLARVESHARFEAWTLALWYVELLILWLCEYQGDYSCRCVREGYSGADDVLPVPWAPAP